MPKKCIICGAEAKYLIKGTSDYYCDECAEENFSDITLLQTVEDKNKEDAAAGTIHDDEADADFEEDSEDDSEQEEE